MEGLGWVFRGCLVHICLRLAFLRDGIRLRAICGYLKVGRGRHDDWRVVGRGCGMKEGVEGGRCDY